MVTVIQAGDDREGCSLAATFEPSRNFASFVVKTDRIEQPRKSTKAKSSVPISFNAKVAKTSQRSQRIEPASRVFLHDLCGLGFATFALKIPWFDGSSFGGRAWTPFRVSVKPAESGVSPSILHALTRAATFEPSRLFASFAVKPDRIEQPRRARSLAKVGFMQSDRESSHPASLPRLHELILGDLCARSSCPSQLKRIGLFSLGPIPRSLLRLGCNRGGFDRGSELAREDRNREQARSHKITCKQQPALKCPGACSGDVYS